MIIQALLWISGKSPNLEMFFTINHPRRKANPPLLPSPFAPSPLPLSMIVRVYCHVVFAQIAAVAEVCCLADTQIDGYRMFLSGNYPAGFFRIEFNRSPITKNRNLPDPTLIPVNSSRYVMYCSHEKHLSGRQCADLTLPIGSN